MSRGFGGTAFEPMEETRDRELTLGPAALIALALGLCAMCAVCFVWGYSVGHRRAIEGKVPQAAPANSPSAAQLLGGPAKPAPTQGNVAPQTGAVPAAGGQNSAAAA